MKNKFAKFVMVMLVACFCFAGTGCTSIFNKNSTGANVNNVVSSTGTEYPTPSGSGTSSVISGNKLYSSVVLNTVSGTKAKYDSHADLDDAVGKSVVMIENTTSSGTSLGAGIIIDVTVTKANGTVDDGLFVLTCGHVITGAVSVKIKISDDNDEYDTYTISAPIADCLVGCDTISDIAVLRYDLSACSTALAASDVVKAKMCDVDADPMRRGEEVYAIGNPDGVEGWASEGIISRLKNYIYLYQIGTMMQLMGTTASINAGNSGGGLFNMYGELVGMVNAANSSLENFAYAVPVATTDDKDSVMDLGLWNVMTQLIANKTDSTYGYVLGRIDTGAMFVYYNGAINNSIYAYVYSISSSGALASAGVRQGDIIKGFVFGGTHGGQAVQGGSATFSGSSAYEAFFNALYKLQSQLQEGDPISVKINILRPTTSSYGLYMQTTYSEVSVTVNDFPQFVYTP